jgi:hypothetical protein
MRERHRPAFSPQPIFLSLALALAACQPRIALEAPKDPIVINLNVKIEHEVRVKVDKELEDAFRNNPELFDQ